MTYAVKEMFYTLQGEGAQTGRPAVFCRFAGCNLWSGLERDRSAAICDFCDTDFVGTDGVGGGKFATAAELSQAVFSHWPHGAGGRPYVVCTGGEPLLQLDTALIEAFHKVGFEVALETNGTLPVPPGVDWVCVSPKQRADFVQQTGDELKVIYPQDRFDLEALAQLGFKHFFLQPMDGESVERHTQLVIEYCKANPQWRLSLQTHKLLGIP